MGEHLNPAEAQQLAQALAALLELKEKGALTDDEARPAPASVRLAIVSAVRLVRESLTLALRDREGLVVVGGLRPDAQSIPLIVELAPDVVLVDVGHADAVASARLIKLACAE